MPQTIGEQLKQARLDRKLTIKNASQATTIRAQYLEALEADDFTSIHSPVQARGFLRIYAEFLGLDAELLPAAHRRDVPPREESAAEANQMENNSQVPPLSESESNPEVDELSLKEEAVSFENYSDPTIDIYDNDVSEENIQAKAILPLPLSQSIFIEIGQQLKGRRELLSLTPVEIERHTHIREHYILALEAGAIDDLHSPVQARGILSSYAKFLDLDADSLLLRYAEGLQASRTERHPYKPKRNLRTDGYGSIIPPTLRRFLSTDLIFGGGMILAMVAFAVWGANRIISQKEQEQGDANSQQSISEALIAATAVTEEATLIPVPTYDVQSPGIALETATPFEIPTIAKTSPVQVITVITGNTWLRVSVDGKVEFQGRAAVGSAYTYNGDEKVDVLAADGSLVQIVFNQKDLGPMGDSGVITEIIYTPKEALFPTPTNTAIPTRTPRVTPTIIPSITPTPVISTEP
jgi:cytoskeleton protein RodZ